MTRHCSIYLRKGQVLIPTQGVICKSGDDGKLIPPGSQFGLVGVEPVAVHDIMNRSGIAQSIVERLVRDNPLVARPKYGFYEPVVLKYVNLKSYTAFAKKASYWTISRDGSTGTYTISPHDNPVPSKKGWQPIKEKAETFPVETPPEMVAQRLVELILGEAAKIGKSNS